MAKTAIYIILGFWVIALVGFWPTYFSRLPDVQLAGHLHGVLVFGWFALLLLQASLIHSRRNALHSALGKISYVYAPVLALGTLLAAHLMLSHGDNPPLDYHLHLLAIILPSVCAFLLLYIQAMRHRRNMQVHARYLIGTAVVYLVPALSRIIGIYFMPFDANSSLSEMTAPDHLALIVMQLFTLALLLNDWRRGRDTRPYGLCLILLVTIEFLFWMLPQQAWWPAFGRAYLALPLGF